MSVRQNTVTAYGFLSEARIKPFNGSPPPRDQEMRKPADVRILAPGRNRPRGRAAREDRSAARAIGERRGEGGAGGPVVLPGDAGMDDVPPRSRRPAFAGRRAAHTQESGHVPRRHGDRLL